MAKARKCDVCDGWVSKYDEYCMQCGSYVPQVEEEDEDEYAGDYGF